MIPFSELNAPTRLYISGEYLDAAGLLTPTEERAVFRFFPRHAGPTYSSLSENLLAIRRRCGVATCCRHRRVRERLVPTSVPLMLDSEWRRRSDGG